MEATSGSGLAASLPLAALALACASSPARDELNTPPGPALAEEGIIHVPAFDFPRSGYLSAETRAALKGQKQESEEVNKTCPYRPPETEEEVVAQRRCWERHSYPALIARFRARYKVEIERETIAGVATQIITPDDGVSAANRHRVLINLHGGNFMYGGGGWGGQVESIPIAAVGKIKVISIDYRMAPEHQFPAASEDVAAVYKALLGTYNPENIGIYGCSAGGLITAEAVAWLLKEGMPVPGAVGMFCAGAWSSGDGDSDHLGAAMTGFLSSTSSKRWNKELSYFKDEDIKDPLAFPGLDPQVMARFPASLLVSSTRDFLLSSVVVTHAQLVRLGVKADLHIWEGLDHAFFFEPDLPESREAYDVIVHFFEENLGAP